MHTFLLREGLLLFPLFICVLDGGPIGQEQRHRLVDDVYELLGSIAHSGL